MSDFMSQISGFTSGKLLIFLVGDIIPIFCLLQSIFFHVKERAQAMQLALEIGCCCPVYKKSHWPSVCKGVISAFKRKLHFLRAFAKNDLPLGCPKIILFQDQINGIPFTIFLSFIDLLMHLGAILCPEDLPVRGFSARYVFLGTVHGKTLKGVRMGAPL